MIGDSQGLHPMDLSFFKKRIDLACPIKDGKLSMYMKVRKFRHIRKGSNILNNYHTKLAKKQVHLLIVNKK